jgi:hypothetical protein
VTSGIDNGYATRCRRANEHTIALGAASILLAPVAVIADFFYAWAAVCGDTGCRATTGAIEREYLCFIFAVVSASVTVVAVISTLCLPHSPRGLAARRVLRLLTAGALVLVLVGLVCVT